MTTTFARFPLFLVALAKAHPLRDSSRRPAIWVRQFLRQTRHLRNDRLGPS